MSYPNYDNDSNEVPIIGENENTPLQDNVRVAQRAFVVVQEADGRWAASTDTRTPVETFLDVTPEDVMQGCQRVHDRLRDEERCALQIQMNMSVAQQMQQAQQDQALRNSLKI